MQHDHGPKLVDGKAGERPLRPPPTFHDEDHPHVHDESNWLVSYADMMTLLFGFFVLMYSLSKVDLDKFELVSKDISKYFGGTVRDKSAGFKMRDEVINVVTRAGIGDGVEVTSTDNGITLKFNGSLLFDSGSARLRQEMQPALTEIAKTIQANRGVKEIKVEGHTDDDPIESDTFPTNWELSSARASRVARHFEAYGFPSEGLIAEGYGSSRPIVPNRNQDGSSIKENQAKNRRVVINVAFGSQVLDATKAIDSKKFIRPGSDEAAKLETTTPDGEPVSNVAAPAGPEISIEQRLEAAKVELDTAQKKLKEMDTEAQKKAKLVELEKKLEETKRKAAETTERIQAMQSGRPIPEKTAAAPAAGTVMTREQGLQQLRQFGQPVTAPDRQPAKAKSPKSGKKARTPQSAAKPAKAPKAKGVPKALPAKGA